MRLCNAAQRRSTVVEEEEEKSHHHRCNGPTCRNRTPLRSLAEQLRAEEKLRYFHRRATFSNEEGEGGAERRRHWPASVVRRWWEDGFALTTAVLEEAPWLIDEVGADYPTRPLRMLPLGSDGLVGALRKGRRRTISGSCSRSGGGGSSSSHYRPQEEEVAEEEEEEGGGGGGEGR